MNIYLASRYSSRERLQGIAIQLVQAGFHVTSSWIYSADRPEQSDMDDRFRQGRSGIDHEDVEKAHILVLDLLDGEGSRGAEWVEFGIALGQSQKLFVIGDTENIFAYHKRVQRLPNWDACFQELISLKQILGA